MSGWTVHGGLVPAALILHKVPKAPATTVVDSKSLCSLSFRTGPTQFSSLQIGCEEAERGARRQWCLQGSTDTVMDVVPVPVDA